ncbi:MAG: cysteine-rich CWC family protein [Aquabacterium sp.]|nr:cysteine-rich CWC family protein [Aquabacterium sp.]
MSSASDKALPNHNCPLCGGPNACAAAESGKLDTPCWCRDVRFNAELLAQVPESLKNKACICAACANKSTA